jgi:hypothetical protein
MSMLRTKINNEIIDINNDELLKTIWEESMRQINGVGSSMSPPLTTYE